MHPSKRLTLPILITSATCATSLGELFIYEPFDYPDTGSPDGIEFLGNGDQAGGLGLGEWRHANSRGDNTNEIEVKVPGLEFTDEGGNVLPSEGGHLVRTSRVGQASASSDVDPAVTAALTADNTTMWMSFLYVDNGFSGPDSAIALTSEDMVAADSANLTSPGFGVGVDIIFNAGGIRTAVYNGGVSSTKVSEATPTFGTNAGTSSDVFLFAAKVNWKPDGTPDEIFVFNVTDLTTEPDESTALTSDTFDMLAANQALLDTLSISETQIDGFDEIRIGTTFESVVGTVAAAGPLELSIAQSSTTPGALDFAWTGQDGRTYDLVSSTDLSTAPATWAVYDGRSGLTGSSLVDVPAGTETKRFFAIIER
ncbi:MAG: hypothetical protein PVJ98_05720 [Akkermansiaceae bacterium]